MKNVTITLDRETAAWTRVHAARRNLSVSRFVGEVLREHMRESREYDGSMKLNAPRRLSFTPSARHTTAPPRSASTPPLERLKATLVTISARPTLIHNSCGSWSKLRREGEAPAEPGSDAARQWRARMGSRPLRVHSASARWGTAPINAK